MTTARRVKKAYQAGITAEEENLPSDCPDTYENSPEERKAWFDGYYTSYLTRRHKATFEKYGIKFP
jgi:ribosome modulation factor